MALKSILVAGAGGNIGSHFTRHLARMPGVGRIGLIDRDVYEERNLVNQDIAPRDLRRPKALVQAERLREIREDLDIRALHAPIERLPLGEWRADLIVACLDSRVARQIVNERAWRLGVPWIDSGVMGSECLARVNVYMPGTDVPCLECAWSDDDYGLLEQEYPCAGDGNATAPTSAASELGALAASLLAIECRRMLAGEMARAAAGQQVMLNARWRRLDVTSFRRSRQCRFDHATWRIEPLPLPPREARIGDLLALSRNVRVAGQRFLRRLVCFPCKAEKKIFRLERSLDADNRLCDECAKPMIPTGFDIVERLGGDLTPDVKNLTLEEAGLRAGDVLEMEDGFTEIVAPA